LGFYNDGDYKVISLFGIKIKIKLKRLILIKELEEQKQQLEEQERRVAGSYYYSKECINLRLQYEKKLSSLRMINNRKIRIVFLVSDARKWSYDYLYKKLEINDRFEPIIAVRTIATVVKETSSALAFFKPRYSNVFICNEETSLIQLSPDIVFYEQPWGLLPFEEVDNIAKFALTCYVPYSVTESATSIYWHLKDFHLKLWKHFILSPLVEDEYNQNFLYYGMNLVESGHPKLDFWLKKENEKKSKKNYVIFAPHFSFQTDSDLKYGTFRWSGLYMLNFAKSHPEFNWIFKPHGSLKEYLLKDEEFRHQAEDYFKEWKRIAIFYDSGSYFDYFRNSMCLITDCGSFLTEYFFSGNPVIHLRSEEAKEYPFVSQQIIANYYKAYDVASLSKNLDQILIKREDPMKMDRIKNMDRLFSKTSASEYICDYLEKELK
ncbi:MAG: hypothetical protein LBH33_05230, partial [Endomicrobium sp.]|nr:hypothetical protein [Endomicrobium sp.]